MYGAFIVLEDQYKASLRDGERVVVQHVKGYVNRSRKLLESLCFLLDYDSLVFFVVDNVGQVRELLNAGICLDLTDISMSINLLEYARNIQFSDCEYIRQCNRLRSAACVSLKNYRVCGPERECLFSSDVVKGCEEMVGLYTRGTYVMFEGNVSIDEYFPGNDSVLEEFYYVQRTFNDLGQRKLYALFAGFAQRRRIIYIGGSPGEAWMDYALEHEHDVISVDPRPLSKRSSSAGRDTIIEVTEKFLGWDRLSEYTDVPFDVIWDVRGDYVNDEQYEAMVLEEIALLNTMIQTLPEKCVRCNIKIREKNLLDYVLAPNGRFYVLPWCLERGKTELRYVFRRNSNEVRKMSLCAVDSVKSFLRNTCNVCRDIRSEFTNLSLYYNSKLMRLDCLNYMNTTTYSKYDLNLFTLNLNTPAQIRAYLEQRKGIISFFYGRRLRDEEHSVPYDNALLLHSIVDSRILIGTRIPYLVLCVPFNHCIYSDELLTSNVYKLRAIGQRISNEYGLQRYHECKALAAVKINKVFVRFPDVFSIEDDIITVSGHAMRMMADSLEKKDYSIFSYFGKVLNNLSEPAGKKVVFRRIYNADCGIKFALVKKRTFEIGRSESFWHSVHEWEAGFIAGEMLIGASHEVSSIFSAFITPVRTIIEKYVGYEIKQFKDKLSIPKGIKSLAGYDSDMNFYEKTKFYMDYIRSNFVGKNGPYNFNSGEDFLVGKRSTIASLLIRDLHIDKYVRYIYFHKYAVNTIGRGAFPDHDDSKFFFDELLPYNLKFYLHDDSPSAVELANEAISLHYSRNAHHPAHWGQEPVPSGALQETVCDLLAMDWLKCDKPKEIYFPFLSKEWIKFVPEDLRQRAIEIHLSLFCEEDFFLLETLREEMNTLQIRMALQHP